MMRRLLFLASCFVATVCDAQKENISDWAITNAPYRIALRAGEKPTNPEAGWEIRLPDFGAGRPDMRDIVLLGNDGKEIGLDCVWRGPGRTVLMLAEAMPADDAVAMLYFGGNNSRQMRRWFAKRSLLLETRKLPAGAKLNTFAGWQDAWNKSLEVDGAAFVPTIFHGGNPFGDSSHYLSRYTGQLITSEGGMMKFFTLAENFSYVMIDGRAALKSQNDKQPQLAQDKVPLVEVRLPEKLVRIEYNHAAERSQGAMSLGWNQGGKLGIVPSEAWLHPGQVKEGAIESRDHEPVPLAKLVATRYLGFGGEWYVNVSFSVADPGDGWQVECLWPDGRVDQGLSIQRLWMSLEPVKIVVRFRKEKRVIEGKQVLIIPREMEAASVNNEGQLKEFLEGLNKENPAALAEPGRRAGFVLAHAFLPPADALRWADAWLSVSKPTHGAWVSAMSLSISEQSKTDAKAALDRLTGFPPDARAVMGRTEDLLEMDLLVFGLKDPLVVALVDRIRKGGDKSLAQMAIIRLGDYYLLNGRLEDAARCFSDAVSNNKDVEQKAPVIDRAHSLAIEDLIKDRHLEEAKIKLESWERQHPAAKIESDQLMWRARVMALAGNWQRALQDLETSLKVRPNSPEEIEVLFWQGRAHYELGRKDEAQKIWNALIENYPKHERAEAAKKWIEKP